MEAFNERLPRVERKAVGANAAVDLVVDDVDLLMVKKKKKMLIGVSDLGKEIYFWLAGCHSGLALLYSTLLYSTLLYSTLLYSTNAKYEVTYIISLV